MKLGITKSLTVTALSILLGAGVALAMNHGGMDHSKMNMGGGAAPAMDHAKMDHTGHAGALIGQTKQEKAGFAYHLIDNAAQMEKAKASGMKMDHDHAQMKPNHLMVYPVDSAGKAIGGAKVGFQVTGPDGKPQQVMAMEMEGGYGADVDMKAKGKYEVKVKLVKGDLQLIDTLPYEAK